MKGRDYKSRILLHTTQGDIVIGLYGETEITAANFESLAQTGFYDGTIFWRIKPGFVIQGGSPDGSQDGGPGYKIVAEFGKGPCRHVRGTIGMARDEDPDSAGSQFFFNLADNERLNGRYTVFGDVLQGMGVVDSIAAVECDAIEYEDQVRGRINIGGRPKNPDDAKVLWTTVMW